jgi:hypothetical protein
VWCVGLRVVFQRPIIYHGVKKGVGQEEKDAIEEVYAFVEVLQMLKNGLIRHKFLFFCFVRTVVVFIYAKRGQMSISHTC